MHAITSPKGPWPLRILLAEDTRALQYVLTKLIEPMVKELVVVGSGREAVECAQNAFREQRPFDLILMDIQMPDVDGLEATRQLKREGYRGPIAALTAGVSKAEHRECFEVGCEYFLSKPIDLEELERIFSGLAKGSCDQPF